MNCSPGHGSQNAFVSENQSTNSHESMHGHTVNYSSRHGSTNAPVFDGQSALDLSTMLQTHRANVRQVMIDISSEDTANCSPGHGSANTVILEGQDALPLNNTRVHHNADGHELADTLSECATNNANVSNTLFARSIMDPSHAQTTNASSRALTAQSKAKSISRVTLSRIGFKKFGLKWSVAKEFIHCTFMPRHKNPNHKSKQMDMTSCKNITIQQQIRMIHEELGYVPANLDYEEIMQHILHVSVNNTGLIQRLHFTKNWFDKYNQMLTAPEFVTYSITKSFKALQEEAIQQVVSTNKPFVSNVNSNSNPLISHEQTSNSNPQAKQPQVKYASQSKLMNDKCAEIRKLKGMYKTEALSLELLRIEYGKLCKLYKKLLKSTDSFHYINNAFKSKLAEQTKEKQITVLCGLIKGNLKIQAIVTAQDMANTIRKLNDEILNEKYKWTNRIKYVLKSIERGFNDGDLHGIRQMLSLDPILTQEHDSAHVSYHRSYWSNGITKDITYTSQERNHTVAKWYYLHPEFTPIKDLIGMDNLYKDMNNMMPKQSQVYTIENAWILNGAKAIASVCELQLTSPLVADKHLLHAENISRMIECKKVDVAVDTTSNIEDLNDIDTISPQEVNIGQMIGVIRIDETPCKHINNSGSVSFCSFQLLGFMRFFCNSLLTLMTLGCIAGSDSSPESIYSINQYFSLLQQQLQQYGPLVIEYGQYIINYALDKIKLIYIFDMKAHNKYLNFMTAGSTYFDPFATKLVPASRATYLLDYSDEIEAELLQKCITNGYVMENIAKYETELVGNWDQIHRWQFEEYCANVEQPTKNVLVFPIIELITPKIDVINYRERKMVFQNPKERLKWRKEQCKRLKIGYYDHPDSELLRLPVFANCHGSVRTIWDSLCKKFTIIRRLERRHPIEEINQMSIVESKLKMQTEMLLKLDQQMTFDETIKLHGTGGLSKLLSYVCGDIAATTDQTIGDTDDDRILKRKRNMAWLFGVESATNILSRTKQIPSDMNWDDNVLSELCVEGVKRYHTLMAMDCKYFSPSNFRFIVLAPRAVVNWKYEMNTGNVGANKDENNNLSLNIPLPYPGSADEGTESWNKLNKSWIVNNSNNQKGMMLRMVKFINFWKIGALEYQLQCWNKSENSKKNEHIELFSGEYDDTAFHPQSRLILQNARKFQNTDLQQLVREDDEMHNVMMAFEKEDYQTIEIQQHCESNQNKPNPKKRKASNTVNNIPKKRRKVEQCPVYQDSDDESEYDFEIEEDESEYE
eukprot:99252_1